MMNEDHTSFWNESWPISKWYCPSSASRGWVKSLESLTRIWFNPEDIQTAHLNTSSVVYGSVPFQNRVHIHPFTLNFLTWSDVGNWTASKENQWIPIQASCKLGMIIVNNTYRYSIHTILSTHSPTPNISYK
jgi:hypothetical protein